MHNIFVYQCINIYTVDPQALVSFKEEEGAYVFWMKQVPVSWTLLSTNSDESFPLIAWS